MSNSGVNTGFAKCFILFMAVVILLQGSLFLGLSIWGITLRQCSKDISNISSKPFQFAMDLIYFLNKDCGNPSIKVPDVSESITLLVNFDKAEPLEYRTFIFFITYALISALWIVTSLAIITSLCCPITKTVNSLCFWSWFLIIMAGSVLDVVATGYHIYDIINTTSVVKTFEYLGITANEKTVEALSNFDAYFITPAVVMTGLSSRVVLIWLLNIFGSCFCLSLSNTLSKRISSQQSINSPETSATFVTNLQQQSRKQISPEQTENQQLSMVTVPSNPGLPTLSSHRKSNAHSQINQYPQPNYIQSSSDLVQNLYPTVYSPIEKQANIVQNKTEAHQYQQELSPISPLNTRYSNNFESLQSSMQNQKVSEELRGQLPWSYTSLPPAIPKKIQTQVFPEIPTPDYGY